MVEYANDGSIIERGRWSFVVVTIESGFDTRVSSSVSYRLDERPNDLPWPGSAQSQGSVQFDAYSDNGSRRYAGTGALLIDTNAMPSAVDRPDDVDLGDFLLAFDSQNIRLSVGHHTPVSGGRNLIFDGYSRRGLSSTVRSADRDTAFTAYALRSEAVRGFAHGLGVSDSERRLAGGELRLQPTPNIALGWGYVTGEGSSGGFAAASDDSPLDGYAGNFVLDSRWLDRQLSFSAEGAYSSLDLGAAYGSAGDRAYLSNVRWQPRQGFRLGDRYVPWSLDLSYARIGRQFRSIANLDQIANVEQLRANMNAQFPTLSLSLAAARLEDNVESELYPGIRSDNVDVSLNWRPAVAPEFGGVLFASPNLGLSLIGDWRETVRRPPASQALPTDMTTRGYTAYALFNHHLGSWRLTSSQSEVSDHTGVMPDYRYRNTGLYLSFSIGDRYSVTPGLQYDVARNLFSGVEQRSTNLNLTQNWMILVDRLYWTLSFGRGGNRLSDQSSDFEQSFLNATLSWRKPRFTLWLQGAWNDTQSEMFDSFNSLTSQFSSDQYQILLGISMTWPRQADATSAAAPATAFAGGSFP
jgi:hypothetical protein